MRYYRVLSVINGLLMSGNVVAAILTTPMIFSPYVDLPLNTHWHLQSQSMRPVDLFTPAKNLEHNCQNERATC